MRDFHQRKSIICSDVASGMLDYEMPKASAEHSSLTTLKHAIWLEFSPMNAMRLSTETTSMIGLLCGLKMDTALARIAAVATRSLSAVSSARFKDDLKSARPLPSSLSTAL